MTPRPAFLLHKRPYRETSALVDLLTFGHGRVRAVAQGMQRPSSRARQRLQPFTPLFVSWQGQRELKRLVVMESRGQTALLAGEGLLCGLYANEIATRLLPVELGADDVFAFYTALLSALPQPAERALALRRFEWALLDLLDATPCFSLADGSGLDTATRYAYEPASRAFVPAAVASQGVSYDGRTLRYLAQGDWQAGGLDLALKHLMRAALAPLLGQQPLRSRQLMIDLARRRRPAAP